MIFFFVNIFTVTLDKYSASFLKNNIKQQTKNFYWRQTF